MVRRIHQVDGAARRFSGCVAKLVRRGEGIIRAGTEEHGNLQGRQVLVSRPLGLAGRVQWVSEQRKRVDYNSLRREPARRCALPSSAHRRRVVRAAGRTASITARQVASSTSGRSGDFLPASWYGNCMRTQATPRDASSRQAYVAERVVHVGAGAGRVDERPAGVTFGFVRGYGDRYAFADLHGRYCGLGTHAGTRCA